MSLRRIHLVLICVFLTAGCSEREDIKVSSAWGPGFKLDGIGKVYSWLPLKEMPNRDAWVDNPSLHTLIRKEFAAGLKMRGFRQSADRDPDFWLTYGVARRRVDDSSVYAHAITYEKGSIHLQVVDPASARVIWHAVAASRIDPSLPADERSRRIALAVKKLLERFPDP